MIDEPQTQRTGAMVAAPVFARIADFALKRLGIAPATVEESLAGAEAADTLTAGEDTADLSDSE